MSNNKSNRLALFIAYLALFVTTIGISVGYKHWLRTHDKAKDALVQITELKAELKQLSANIKTPPPNKELAETSAIIHEALQQLANIQQQTHYSAQSVRQQISELSMQQNKLMGDQGGKDLFIHALHLLESADWQLTYFHNKKGALSLLARADTLLMQLGSSQLISIRQQLSHDIVTLEQYPLPEYTKVAEQISQLQQSMTPLAKLHTDNQAGEKIALFTIEDDQSVMGTVKAYLNDSIDIVEYDELATHTISQSDRQRMDVLFALHFQNLKLQLSLRDKKGFQQQALLIKALMTRYYPQSIAQPWMSAIEVLSQLDITPKPPMISSLVALKTLGK
ncbi:MAG: uroporphyrinogen-III C-methyltransferase [Thiotrichaceae bacterium]|nr:uroporphyrinogen-III C-methyltransferase [Thiotrichaceae bacterium]